MDLNQTDRPPLARPPPYPGSGSRTRDFVLFVLLLLASSLTSPAAVSASTDDAEPVRIAGAVYLGDLPTVIAEHDDLFAARGIDAEVRYELTGKHSLRRLRTGDTDFALMALTPLVLDLLADETRGEPDDPVILASLLHSTELNDVITLSGSGIEKPSDLVGRKIGLGMGTNAEFVWWLFAHVNELDPAGVRVADWPLDRISEALADGTLDAAVTWEPWTSRIAEQHGDDLHRFTGTDAYISKWVLVARRALVADHPQRVRAVLRAYHDAIETIEREPAHAIRVYAQRSQVTASILRRNRRELDYDLNLDWSLITALQQQIAWARRSGYPVAQAEVAVLEAIDAGPLRAVLPNKVGIPTTAGAISTP